MTEEKKTPEKVQVTSGKDTAAFVAAKPHAAEKVVQEKPADIGKLSEEDVASHQQKIAKLQEDFEAEKARIAEEQRQLQTEHQVFLETKRAEREELAAIAAAKASRDADASGSHFGGDTTAVRQVIDPGRVPPGYDENGRKVQNERGAPIPVTEQNQRVRHISEIGDSYNGKPETLED